MLVIDQFRKLLKRVDPTLLSSADRRALLDLYEASTPAARVPKQAGGGLPYEPVGDPAHLVSAPAQLIEQLAV